MNDESSSDPAPLVAVIKRDGHDFGPDRPGTDSYRLRRAGSVAVSC